MVRSQGIVLVEGSIDTILQHQDGFPNTGGILGSKLSEIQARYVASLRPKCVYTMFDADASGIGAIDFNGTAHSQHPNPCVQIPEGKDRPSGTDQKERERVIAKAISFSKFRQITRSMSRPKERTNVGTY
jgi:DNA primase